MLTLNRYPLSALGLVPTDISGWLTGARAQRSAAGIPGRVSTVLGAKRAAAARVLTVGVLAPLASETERPSVIARVEHALLDQRVAIETVDRPGVQTWAACDLIDWREAAPNAPKLAVPSISGVIQFVALDGGSEDVEPAVPVLLGTTRAAIPAGTLPTGGMVLLWGYTAPVTLTYAPANGVGSTALTIGQAVATGEHVALNLDTQEAFFVPVSGARSAFLPSGSWPTLDPTDAVGAGLIDGTSATAYATLTTSSGTGLWLGRRRYRL